MPENASPLYDLFQSTWTRCSTVSKWICKPISSILEFLPLCRPSCSSIEEPFHRSLSNFANHNTSYRVSPYMDVIDIVSSESDGDIEVEDDEFDNMHSSNTDSGRRQSARLFGDMREGFKPQSHDYVSERQAPVGQNSFPRSVSDATSTNQHSKRFLPSSFQNNGKGANVKPALGSRGRPNFNATQKENLVLDNDQQSESTTYTRDSQGRHEKLRQDSSKRVFPSSFRPIAKLDSKIPSESKSISDFDWKSRAYHGSTHNRQGVSPHSFNDGKFITSSSGNSSSLTSYSIDFKDKFPRPNSNGAVATSTSDRFESHRLISGKFHGMPRSSAERKDGYYAHGIPGVCRVLPSSMIHGKYNNLTKSGFHDADKDLVHGEDRERLIYQQALENLNQPKTEEDLPDGLLAVPLLKHQKIALAWMVMKEQSAVCTGGILADDQGLGKTVSMIALIQKQRPEQLRYVSGDSNGKKLEALNIDDDDDEGLCQVVEKQMPTEADDIKQGTVETIAKCVHLDEKRLPTRSDDTEHATVDSTSKCPSGSSRPAGGTLVVCPASILRQWARELDEKISERGKLSVLVYYGGSRTKSPHDLTKYDVVLTTYAIVVNEVPKQLNADDGEMDQKNADRYGLAPEFCANNKRKQNNSDRKKQKKKRKGLDDSDIGISGGALARVRWFRVILDEAQTIKNFRTLVASACCSLRAKRRWCLSGTPIQNSIDDIFSYFRFLKFEPYDNYGQFSLLIKNHISKDRVNGYKKLQAVLKTMLLRRTKGTLIDGKPVLKLPPKTISLVKIDFEQEEREFYSRLEADTRKQFKAFDDAGTLNQNYASILVLLLRLRQACDHPFLVSNRAHSDTTSKESSSVVKQLPKDTVINLLNQLEGSAAICVLCSDPPEDAVVSMCGHVFCYQCVSDRLTGEDNSCPSAGCRDTLGADLVFSKSTLRTCISDNLDTTASTNCSSFSEEHLVTSSSYASSKIKAAIDVLNKLRSSNSEASHQNENGECSPVRKYDNDNSIAGSSDANTTSSSSNSNPGVPSKAIVFSQWTGMLDLLEQSLNHEFIQYRRLDGSMPLNLRDKAVKDFNTDPEVAVMLMSLKAGCLGLNMVAACHVILLDLWWNPTTEDQAIDRAHRIGQTRPVTVSRLTITNTVEDRILSLQETKRNMVASCFGEDAGGSHATGLTMDELRYLFNG